MWGNQIFVEFQVEETKKFLYLAGAQKTRLHLGFAVPGIQEASKPGDSRLSARNFVDFQGNWTITRPFCTHVRARVRYV